MSDDTDIARSSSLADLAARIGAEHEATDVALKRSVEHSMAAGDLLLEAKAQVPHGQWLPWLREHCAMSERTAQLPSLSMAAWVAASLGAHARAEHAEGRAGFR